MTEPKTVEYFAKSVFSSFTINANGIVLALSAAMMLDEVRALVPVEYMPMFTALVAVLNIWRRTQSVRPVAFMAPGEVKGISVERLKATQ